MKGSRLEEAHWQQEGIKKREQGGAHRKVGVAEGGGRGAKGSGIVDGCRSLLSLWHHC